MKDVKVEAAYSPINETYAFNVKVMDPKEPLKFGMLFGEDFDPVDCKVFGIQTISCGLHPKLPVCEGCPLAEGFKKTDLLKRDPSN